VRIHYKKTFLNKVVVRVDFASPVELLQKRLPPVVSGALLTTFPISEPQKVVGKELKIGPEDTQERAFEQMNWMYYSKDKQKQACLSKDFFWISYGVYDSFEQLKGDFLPILEGLFKSIEELQVKRVGLRYIDHITFDERNVFDWSEYLDGSLLSAFSIPRYEKPILRAFSNFTVGGEDMVLKLQYGMHNPDFPAVIKKKLFIIDTDAYTEGLLELSDIHTKLDKFHDAIGNLFEKLITDKLRDVMGVEHAE